MAEFPGPAASGFFRMKAEGMAAKAETALSGLRLALPDADGFAARERLVNACVDTMQAAGVADARALTDHVETEAPRRAALAGQPEGQPEGVDMERWKAAALARLERIAAKREALASAPVPEFPQWAAVEHGGAAADAAADANAAARAAFEARHGRVSGGGGNWRITPRSVADGVDVARPARQFAIPDLQIGKLSLLGAHPGAGKSAFQLLRHARITAGYDVSRMAIAGIVEGEPRPASSLYLCLEDERDELLGRLQALISHYGMDLQPEAWARFHVATSEDLRWPPLTAENWPQAEAALADAVAETGAELVTVDTLSDLGAGEDNEAFTWLANGLRRIAREQSAHICLLHHFRKGAPGLPDAAGNEQFRGGGVLVAKARYAVILTPGPDCVTETVTKNTHGVSGVRRGWRIVAADALNGEAQPVFERMEAPELPLEPWGMEAAQDALRRRSATCQPPNGAPAFAPVAADGRAWRWPKPWAKAPGRVITEARSKGRWRAAWKPC